MVDESDYQGPAEPGTPLEPDELAPSPPEFQAPVQGPRQESGAKPKGHPTSELSSLKTGRSVGKPSSGTHPTSELHVKPKGRR